jgi:hypothetical protein
LEESSGRSVALLQIDAVMVDKILKGIKPAYLPVEQQNSLNSSPTRKNRIDVNNSA